MKNKPELLEKVNFMSSILKEKSYLFAINSVKLCRQLTSDKKEFVLSKQILRSGTAIGALVSEAVYAQSKADFIHKLNIALKEANETEYWLNLLKDTQAIGENEFNKFDKDIKELLKILISSIKTSKSKA